MKTYDAFLKQKEITDVPTGIDSGFNINPMLFDFQRDIVKWALKMGKAAIWADCGLGKSFIQLEIAKHIHEHTQGDVLILAPLAVTSQTKAEGVKIGIDVHVCRRQEDVKKGINITNYQMLDKFNPSSYAAIILDESSILKSFTGQIRTQIISMFAKTPYRYACTATPAPNDYMELGNHAEFLGVMLRTEMLSMFFVHDGGDTAKWRLKGHADEKYWEWLCSWAVMMAKPSDINYDDNGFILPDIKHHEHVIATNQKLEGELYVREAQTLNEQQKARRQTIQDRVSFTADLINNTADTWLVWCNLNDESEALNKAIHNSVEVKGAQSLEHKEKAMIDFTEGKIKCLISKPSICGHGMNWQHCSNVAFVGLSHSYEQYYQAIRRCWRFGQKKEVNIHIITADIEGSVLHSIKRKEIYAEKMKKNMIVHMQKLNEKNIKNIARSVNHYSPRAKMELPLWI